MTLVIPVLGVDPSFRNWGMASAIVHFAGPTIEIKSLTLIETERQERKQVRQSSDDLRCASETQKGFLAAALLHRIAFAEIPSGSQSSRGSFSNGICTGILSSSPIEIIQVTPMEVKLATVGNKKASKDEMIVWAVKTYPDAGWLKRKSRGEIVLLNSNEHLADACAAIHAGVQTPEFKRLASLLSTVPLAA